MRRPLTTIISSLSVLPVIIGAPVVMAGCSAGSPEYQAFQLRSTMIGAESASTSAERSEAQTKQIVQKLDGVLAQLRSSDRTMDGLRTECAAKVQRAGGRASSTSPALPAAAR